MEPEPDPRRWTRGALALGVLGLVLAVLTPVLSTLASGEFRWGNFWFWLLVVASGGTWVTGRVATRQARKQQWAAEDSERMARIDTRIQIADVLRPLAETLAKLPSLSKAEKREQCESMKRGVVDAAAELLGPERSRAGWFEYQEGRPARLVPVAELRRGRADPQRTEFVQGTLEGTRPLALLDNDTTRFCADVDLDPPPGWDGDAHPVYRTFISAGVVADGRKFGMLTLDALEPGDLTENDVYAMSLLAKLLAAALAQI